MAILGQIYNLWPSECYPSDLVLQHVEMLLNGGTPPHPWVISIFQILPIATSAIDINVWPAAWGKLKMPRSDKLSTSVGQVKFS